METMMSGFAGGAAVGHLADVDAACHALDALFGDEFGCEFAVGDAEEGTLDGAVFLEVGHHLADN